MKKKLLFVILFLFSSTTAFCITWTVTNVGTTFSPASITITVGDSVNFSIPSPHDALEVSQASWNIDDVTPLPGGFYATPAAGLVLPSQLGVGVHYYICVTHASVSMKGIITVQNCTIPAQPGSITGNASVCSGSAYSYSVASVSGATSYTWTLPGGWTGSSTTNSINPTAGATSGNITVTANNACGSSTVRSLAVTSSASIPATPGTISGNGSVCAGSSNTYSVVAVSGATSYTWTLPGGWTGSSTTNSINTTASASSGNITVTANNTCGSSSAQSLSISSDAVPATPGTITGSSTFCSGEAGTYSIAAVSGATSYTWTLPGSWTGSSTTTSINTTAGSSGGTITVTANNACGSSSDRTLNVTLISTPATPGAISGNSFFCAGSANTYSISTVSGATSYTWTLPASWSGSSTTNSINATAGTTGGNITVSANNACGSSSAQSLTLTLINIPATPGVITGSSTFCSGSSNTYSVAAVNGATSYTWTLPSGWTGTSTTNSITATASATPGNITVTANNDCGTSSAQTLAVALITAPPTPGTISGNISVCKNSSNTYSIAAVSGATSYIWTLPGGWTGTSTTNSINTTAGAGSGNVTVTARNSCGNSSAQSLAVTTASPPATPGAISGNTSVCSGSSNTYNIAAVSGATSYTWTLPGGWTGTSTTNSINATAGSTGGTISVTANDSCGASAAQSLIVSIITAPASPGAISGNASFCAGTLNIYSVSTVPGASSYTWTLPVGWTGASTTNSINATAGNAGGTISVTANNTCGPSSAQTLNVTVTNIPATPGSITGNASPCAGSTISYSVASVSGATSYTWSLPGGWAGTSTTNSINTTTGSSGGTISVIANNVCGSSSARSLSVTTSSTPSTPGSISGNPTVCAGSSNTYSISSVSGATSYTWSLPGGWTGNSTSTSIGTTAGSSSGTITVTANNSCGPSSQRSFNVTVNNPPSTPGSIGGSTSVCEGSSNSYNIASVSGATSYTWTLPSGWSGFSTSNSIFGTSSATSGNITVTANNSCGSSSPRSLAVTVSIPPSTPGSISGLTSVCSGSSHTYSISSVSGATSYSWTLPSGWSGTSTSTSINATASSTSGDITVSANNSCGASATSSVSVISSNGTPAQPGAISGNASVCNASFNVYSVTPVPGALSYAWTLPASWAGSSSTNSISVLAGATGGTISVSASNACATSTAQSMNVTVTSGSAPPQPGSITGNNSICFGTTNTYSIAPVSGATSYTWNLPGGWTGTSSTTSITATADTSSGNISVSANNACGSSAANQLNITVINAPAIPDTILGNSLICNGSSNVYSIVPVSGAISYTWTLPNGWLGNSTTHSITALANSNGGNVTVRVTDACGTSGPKTLAVSTTGIPANAGVISGIVSVCSGSSYTYEIAAVSGATSYTWILPSGWSGNSNTNSITATAGSVSGNISVTANNACGSSSAQLLNVSLIPVDTSVTVTATSLISNATGASYQWYDCLLNQIIPFETSQTFIPGGNGEYAVIVIENSCQDTSACINYVTLGIEENGEISGLNIYPNPTAGKVQVELSSYQSTDEYRIEVYTILGDFIYTSEITSRSTTLDLSEEPGGIYFMKVYHGHRVQTTRIALQN